MKLEKILVRERDKPYEASELSKLIDEIVLFAVDKISERAADDNSDIKFIHPKTLISVLVCNLVINLAGGMINGSCITNRAKLFFDLITEMNVMLHDSWIQLEAQMKKEGEEIH